MEKITGQALGSLWYDLSEKQRVKLVGEVAKVEAKMFAIELPANGSIYKREDLPKDSKTCNFTHGDASEFSIGQDTGLRFWFEERRLLEVDKGPREFHWRISRTLI